MKLTLTLKAKEYQALRRAVSTLYSEELARNPFRPRKSKLAETCEDLMDKLCEAAGEEKQA